MVARAGRQVRDLDRRSRDLRRAGRVREAHDRVGIRDVEVVADQRHAERRVQVVGEHRAQVRHAVAVGVAQQA
jgi:hypothetical protein